MTNRVFISYRRKDSHQVDALVVALKQEGLAVWLDRNEIDDAASIQNRINEGLADSHALLAWYSVDYPKSRACQWELTAAVIAAASESKPVKRLLVVNPEADAAHIQPIQVRDVQYLPHRTEDDYADLAKRVYAAVVPVEGSFGALRRLTQPYWHGYHGLGSNRFIGRVEDLWAIHSALSDGNFAIVAGLPAPRGIGELVQVRGGGGIGKSLLAEEYALRFGAWWPGGVFWLRAYGHRDKPHEGAEAPVAWRGAAYGSQLTSFARALGLETEECSDDEVHDMLGRYLARQGLPYLWIVDDLPACGREELERWLAPAPLGQTLVTTRSRRLDGLGMEIDLTILPANDSRALLTVDHPHLPEETQVVNRILTLLDGHPLALDVARVACRRLGYAGFLQRLEQPDQDALTLAAEIAGDLPNGHNPYIAATLLTSLQQLDESALDCLRLASQLTTAPIPIELLADCLAEADNLDKGDAQIRAAKGVNQALLGSVADEADGTDAYQVHTLVTHTMRRHDTDPERGKALGRTVLSILVRKMEAAVDIQNHARLKQLLPHVQALASETISLENLLLAGWLGRFEWEGGRDQAAQRWYEAQYQGMRRMLGEEHQFTLTSMDNLALTLWRQGKLDQARMLQERVLNAFLKLLGGEHTLTLTSMANLANTLRNQGNLVQSQAFHETALEGRRRTLGDTHQDTLSSMSNLAQTYSAHGDLSKARALQERVLNAYLCAFGKEHPKTLECKIDLADTYFAQGDLNGARSIQEDVLEAAPRTWGNEHPNTLTAMNNLAETHRTQRDFSGARRLHEDVLEISSRVMGESSPYAINAMNNLALTLLDQGDLTEAKELLGHALENSSRVFGQDNPDTLAIMNNLGFTLWQLGEYERGFLLMQAAADGRERVLGPQHQDTQLSRDDANQMRSTLAQKAKMKNIDGQNWI